jgi:methylsterol monooxygenase
MQNDTLATGILSFTMHELVYFGRSLPWVIIDAIPFFNKYKIQNVLSAHALLRSKVF